MMSDNAEIVTRGARAFSNARMAEASEGIDIADTLSDQHVMFDTEKLHSSSSPSLPRTQSDYNPVPQSAPGAHCAGGSSISNSIPLSIFPVATDKFCVCFCGMPGRGKTHIARRLAKYLSFFHNMEVEIFSVTEYRRKNCNDFRGADWFDPSNSAAKDMRNTYNQAAIDNMVMFLNSHESGVAIFDATNTQHSRRTNLVTSVRRIRSSSQY